jgi:hypothetical protein
MKPVAQLRARARTCATRGNLNSAKQCHPGLTSPGGKTRKWNRSIVRIPVQAINYRCR